MIIYTLIILLITPVGSIPQPSGMQFSSQKVCREAGLEIVADIARQYQKKAGFDCVPIGIAI